jgi:hypothetical protein
MLGLGFSLHIIFSFKLVGHYNDVMFLVWWTKHVSWVEYVVFMFGPQVYMFHWIDLNIGVMSMVTKKDWAKVVKNFKAQCVSTIANLIIKLEKQFPTQELLSFINMIFPQY